MWVFCERSNLSHYYLYGLCREAKGGCNDFCEYCIEDEKNKENDCSCNYYLDKELKINRNTK